MDDTHAMKNEANRNRNAHAMEKSTHKLATINTIKNIKYRGKSAIFAVRK